MEEEDSGDDLKLAYCKIIGADSIIGLDCCDDYKDWVAGLSDTTVVNDR